MTGAIYVTYNPDCETLRQSLLAMGPQVGPMIVVDNSDSAAAGESVREAVMALKTKAIELIAFGENKGIAAALNAGFRRAAELGCSFCVTMDQDSIAPEGMVAALTATLSDSVGQSGPAYSFRGTSGRKDQGLAGTVEVDHVITSGALTSVEAWKQVGGFREDLFIDMVDIDFSHRIKAEGWTVLQDRDIVMDHHMGDERKGLMLAGKLRFVYLEHSPVRWYYMVRNSLEVGDRTYRLKRIWKNVLKMLLFGSDKAEKLKYIRRGIADYRAHRFGKLDMKPRR